MTTGRTRGIALLLTACLVPAGAARAASPEKGRVDVSNLFSASVGSGARALAMGGAFIAIADDATASSWNPAGLCVLEKPEASVVFQPGSRFSTNFATSNFTDNNSDPISGFQQSEVDNAFTSTQSGTSFDFASATLPLRIGSVKLVPQFNFQRVANLALEPKIDSFAYSGTLTLAGFTPITYTGSGSQTGSFSGGLDVYAFSLGVSFNPKIYLGASVNLWRKGSNGTRTVVSNETDTGDLGSIKLQQNRNFTSNETFQGTNFNVGVLFKPVEQLHIGAVYKSRFDMTYALNQTQNLTITGLGGPIQSTTTTQEAGTIRWPQTVGVGLAVLPTDALTFAADFTTSNWSKTTYNFTRTTNITDNQGSPPQTSTQGLSVIWPTYFDPTKPEQGVLNSGQVNTQQIRFGTEYVVKSPGFLGLVAFPLRAGVFTDRQYFKDSSLNNVSYLGITGGLGLVWSHVTLDFAYVHSSGSFRSQDFTNTQGLETVSRMSNQEDTIRSNQFFVSTTVRF
jgi:long-chain fatty acid transport protein